MNWRSHKITFKESLRTNYQTVARKIQLPLGKSFSWTKHTTHTEMYLYKTMHTFGTDFTNALATPRPTFSPG